MIAGQYNIFGTSMRGQACDWISKDDDGAGISQETAGGQGMIFGRHFLQ